VLRAIFGVYGDPKNSRLISKRIEQRDFGTALNSRQSEEQATTMDPERASRPALSGCSTEMTSALLTSRLAIGLCHKSP
jgi:hypothetical protein